MNFHCDLLSWLCLQQSYIRPSPFSVSLSIFSLSLLVQIFFAVPVQKSTVTSSSSLIWKHHFPFPLVSGLVLSCSVIRLHCGRLHFLGLLCFTWLGGGCCAAREGQGKRAADSLQLFKQPNHLILSFPSESRNQHFKASLGSCLLLIFLHLNGRIMFLAHVFSSQGPPPGPAESKCTTQSQHTAPALQLPSSRVS